MLIAARLRPLCAIVGGVLSVIVTASACVSPSSSAASRSAAGEGGATATTNAATMPSASGHEQAPSASAIKPSAPKPPPKPAEPKQVVSAKRALSILFLDDPSQAAKDCVKQTSRSKAVECLLNERYNADARARNDALAIYRIAGWVVGLEHARTMDGGWRGMLKLVPELPVGRHRRHLAWLKHSATEMARFFHALESHSKAAPKYRWRGLELNFFRSVGRTTPSAYAHNWAIAYNVSGSLHSSAEAVRETMFHEVFHLNDDGFSSKQLESIHKSIAKRCKRGKKMSSACLRPYAPHSTMVRGGTYYAFEPGNGVWEYAAELAVRYNQEHRALWLSGPPKKPFKCGPTENAKAWKAMVDSMFAGVDAVPACKK